MYVIRLIVDVGGGIVPTGVELRVLDTNTLRRSVSFNLNVYLNSIE